MSDAERLGIYRIESLLGQGGMGEVLLAWDPLLERHVAIKRIRGELLADAHQRSRFLREARAVARLSHPTIVQIFHVLEHPDGDCLVMEHVKGSDLAKIVADRPMDARRSLPIARQIADGLGEAHAQGMVHRDLKLSNVMVSTSDRVASDRVASDRVTILDFGLAKALWPQTDSPDETLTRAGTLLGTAHAMSPEQAGGGEVDHRSDLFSLGSLLYELLSGRAPFLGENTLDSLRRVLTTEPEPLDRLVPNLPSELPALAGQLLRKNPDERPQSARWVAMRLQFIFDQIHLAGSVGQGPRKGHSTAPDQPTAPVPRMTLPQAPGLVSPARVASPPTLLVLRLIESEAPPADLQPWLERFHGRRVEATCFQFERPAEAVAFALECHRLNVRLGIGIHLDDPPSADAPTLLGASISTPPARELAERLAERAQEGSTLLTRGVFDAARRARTPFELAAADIQWQARGGHHLEGQDLSMEIFAVGTSARPVLLSSTGVPREDPGWRPAVGQEVPRRPRWRLVERLGEGGFGEVWLGRHAGGDERVFKFCFELNRLRGLKREVTLFRLLKENLGRRPDIARILDWDFDETPYFLEAEHTDGGHLTAWMKRQGGERAVPLGTRLELVAQVADALSAAHSVGVLHKDVKPQNVLVAHDSEGRPQARLTDFGIGLLTDTGRLRESGFTVLGFTESLADEELGAGSVRYLAPELLEGKPASTQADVYSLGVLLYQMAVGDLGRALAAGWRRDIDDALLKGDIAACVDGRPERRLAHPIELAQRLRTLDDRRRALEQERLDRERRRRAMGRRRLASGLVAVALLVAAVASVFAIQTLHAKRLAEQRRLQAEKLIDFLLGDLRRDLEPIGKLGILDKVGDQAMDYFATVPEGALSDDELASYSKALHQVGQVRFSLGRLPEAGRAFEQSLRLAQSYVDRDPQQPNRLFELGQSHFWLGYLNWRQRKLDQAFEPFSAYARISEELVDLDPENHAWRLELAFSQSNLGSILEEKNELAKAHGALRSSVSVFEDLVAEQPDDLQLFVEMAHVQAKLGQTLYRQGNLEHALEQFRSALRAYQTASEANPSDAQLWQFVGTAHGHVGDVLMDLGRTEEGLQQWNADLESARRLTTHDPDNLLWKEHLTIRVNKVARGLVDLEQGDRAVELLQEEKTLLEGLDDPEFNEVPWRLARARHECSKAEYFLAVGAANKGLTASRSCVEIVDDLLRENDDRNHRGWSARCHYALGLSLDTLGRRDEARAAYAKAREALQPIIDRFPFPAEVSLWERLLPLVAHPTESDP